MKILINNHIFRNRPLLKEYVKFCLVGLTNLAIDLIIYWFFTRIVGLYYIVAAILSFVVAVSWSFYINRKWTFRHSGVNLRAQYVKFFIANGIAINIQLVLLYLLVDIGGIFDLFAKLITTVIVSVINFSLNKWWTFASDNRKQTKEKGNF